MRKFRHCVILTLVFVLALQSFAATSTSAASANFSDVPESHWAAEYINELRDMGITDGVGNNRFGLGQKITRAEFTAFMCKLMKWEAVSGVTGSFKDNVDSSKWYFGFIEAALQHGAVLADSEYFYPDTPITRADMAVMLVRTLGYDALGKRIDYLGSPFPDVSSNIGYITIAKDLGIITGVSSTQFAPADTATREQAAAMLIRMQRLLGNKPSFTNGFYAINSYSQVGMIDSLDAVCFGWSRLELSDGAVSLNTSAANSNEYNVPSGYETPFARADGKQRLLMVAVKEADSPTIINDDKLRQSAADVISQAALEGIISGSNTIAFDGVVIDFEALRGQQTKSNFNDFLTALKSKLTESGKQIYVAVQPQRRAGIAYYDGYDYKTIGDIADKVILMAHDYYPRTLTAADMENGVTRTPAAPLDEVYYAVKAICDPVTGVADRSKVLLQISFDSVQWKTSGGKTVNQTPYSPAYSAIVQRIQSGAKMEYDSVSQSPYISFYNSEDATDNIVWYEDARSVNEKIKLANMFGLGGVSYWRLGIIPDFAEEMHLDVFGVR